MHINGIIITKEFISHRNSKWFRGSVGRAHMYVGYIFIMMGIFGTLDSK